MFQAVIRPSSGKTNIKYVKKGKIKMKEVSLAYIKSLDVLACNKAICRHD
jgi:hypothetical protein